MRYTLSIITKNVWSSEFLKNQLENLFGKLFQITCHSPDTNPIIPIYNADMILLHEPSALTEMQSYIKCDSPVLLMRRTITLEALYKLKKVPQGVSAVVVNLTDYMANETMINIYQLGIKKIHMIPWSPENDKPFPEVDYVFTHRMYDFLPEINKPTVILGSRVLTPDVIMDILSYFNIDIEITEKIFKYYSTIVPSFLKGVRYLLENNRFLSAQWNLLFNKINKGVCIINKYNKITSYNKLFLNYLKPLKEIPDDLEKLTEQFPQFSIISNNKELLNEVIEIDGYKYVIDMNYLDAENYSMGRVLMIEPYKQIQLTQQTVHKRIVGKRNYAKYTFDNIIGESTSIKKAIKLGKSFSKGKLPVLIYGESGTGKELMASAIHNYSDRSNKSFIAVNCAGIPDNLLESEFFGYESSAFTGAKKGGTVGLFEKAHGGTLFLDEISEIPYGLQGKLLRAIQENEIRKVGANYSISIDVRIIAASNRKLSNMVNENKFRRDLFFRLNVFSLTLPPLRKRGADVIVLFKNFLKLKNRKATKSFHSFVKKYNWPGNVRELINVIEFMNVVSNGDFDIDFLPDYIKEQNVIKDFYVSSDKNMEEVLMLKSVYLCDKMNKGTGRRTISRFFSDSFYKISEVQTRNILISLSKKGYLIINKGRSGCKLTSKGMSYLKNKI